MHLCISKVYVQIFSSGRDVTRVEYDMRQCCTGVTTTHRRGCKTTSAIGLPDRHCPTLQLPNFYCFGDITESQTTRLAKIYKQITVKFCKNPRLYMIILIMQTMKTTHTVHTCTLIYRGSWCWYQQPIRLRPIENSLFCQGRDGICGTQTPN